jgi:phosphotransacetylase
MPPNRLSFRRLEETIVELETRVIRLENALEARDLVIGSLRAEIEKTETCVWGAVMADDVIRQLRLASITKQAVSSSAAVNIAESCRSLAIIADLVVTQSCPEDELDALIERAITTISRVATKELDITTKFVIPDMDGLSLRDKTRVTMQDE